ncbi:NAD(P)-dependent alcohol dehydrogenase [Aquiflexum gelatinilyticum]|uniref:NAD(P)-dependent alcohol dehydrogenase n=1 Tax=Aquiflexum gelatinilyticum TaxID=2961943 RepID=A0A9X2P3L1_9BACT|nr:NAD(P)-dependent alcohol dehydrogenase [Aquiflexum gelatinilyticum]MCR9015579.1 NAD(P)-dependent alcohol dehydrogenase [Aquiflexum gelatinilyticum]
MKAIVNSKYGTPDVLQLMEVPKPVPKDTEVLIKVHATTVNRTDCGFRKPDYFIIRLFNGFFKPKVKILGSEFAGTVESFGSKVSGFKTGDEVFGLSTKKFGAHAEYICVPESGSIAIKPVNFTFEEAAAVCDGLMLANGFLKDLDYSKPQKILINGASGSIGTAGVQLAKFFGAEVTAVCNTKSMDLVRSLGADEVIDYTKKDFTLAGNDFDFVFDAVGKSSYFKCRKLLKPNGVYVSTEFGYLAQNVFLTLLTPLFGGKKVKFPIVTDSKSDIVFFKELIESGKYRAVIDRRYPLSKIIEATKYVETKEKVGNVVIDIG